ncbi:hypothetical protein ACPOL_6244 [Acidisarcina polymorpha]|uniref:Uncharacterized protein n=1 Tax=Acidisarcina polymorpha TaxID=2211140 RepID=A0A2Z5GA79_9BACT|nr:hypothetical protein ACPOL_6244 [Acidisarcina polymorpha]
MSAPNAGEAACPSSDVVRSGSEDQDSVFSPLEAVRCYTWNTSGMSSSAR